MNSMPPNGPRADETCLLQATIFYDDLTAGQRAIRVIRGTNQRLRQLEVGISLDFQFCPLSLLRDPRGYSYALSLMAEPDLIIISTTNPDAALSEEFRRLIDQCFSNPETRPHAFVGLLGQEGEEVAGGSSLRNYLQEVTQRSGIDLFTMDEDHLVGRVDFRKTVAPLIHRSSWSPLND